ncbi:MAG: type II toxin-antitoxin system VapC family toxin [Cyanobacteria bacterium J06623_5]
MNEVVLDASAILAFLNQEEGAAAISQYLKNGIISAVNLSEVIAKLAERGVSKSLVQEFVEQLSIRVAPMDKTQAVIAGLLRNETKSFGLSLGDRVCVALGLHLKIPVITTDRQWDKLSIKGLEVRVVR